MRACEILPHILIDNLHWFNHTWNSTVDAYHGKWAFMPLSVLELLPKFKSTYFGSMNPPNKTSKHDQKFVKMADVGRQSIASLISFSIYPKLTVLVVSHYFKENI